MIDLLLNVETKDSDIKEACKGLLYRANVNAFVSARGDIIRSIQMRLLKRRSCKGCESCDPKKDYLMDVIFEMTEGFSPEQHDIFTLEWEGGRSCNSDYEYEDEWNLYWRKHND